MAGSSLFTVMTIIFGTEFSATFRKNSNVNWQSIRLLFLWKGFDSQYSFGLVINIFD